MWAMRMSTLSSMVSWDDHGDTYWTQSNATLPLGLRVWCSSTLASPSHLWTVQQGAFSCTACAQVEALREELQLERQRNRESLMQLIELKEIAMKKEHAQQLEYIQKELSLLTGAPTRTPSGALQVTWVSGYDIGKKRDQCRFCIALSCRGGQVSGGAPAEVCVRYAVPYVATRQLPTDAAARDPRDGSDLSDGLLGEVH